MEKTKPQEGFFKHREHELQPAQVTRSSAVFYALQSAAVETELLLFNYWLHKRGVDGLTLVLTLRGLDGAVVRRESEPLSFTGARTVKVSALLARAGLPPRAFEGSLEMEVLSTVNLVIPYPAVIVRYHGRDWHTTTHSYSRVLTETSGDSRARMDALQATCEGNWTIHPDAALRTFFVVHNGPRSVEAHDLRLTLTNHRGERLERLVTGVAYAPFETRRFFPDESMDVVAHLDGRPGSLEVSTHVAGVFPRMLCGHVRIADGALSVDHSNFNYTGAVGSSDALPVSGAGTKKPMGFIVPTLAGKDWSCWADFYPTYPDRGYRASLVVRGADGTAKSSSAAVIGEGRSPGIVRVPVSELVCAHAAVGAVDFTITHDTRVPTRFHMGIHYRYGAGMPAFLIDGPMPYTATGIRSRWFPCLFGPESKTFLFMSNQVFDSAESSDLVYEATAYNVRGDAPLKATFALKAGATLAADVRDLVPGLEAFLGGEAGWVYLKADKPALSVVHYLMLHGRDSLAVDHAF